MNLLPRHREPGRESNYDKFPSVHAGERSLCLRGWDQIFEAIGGQSRIIVIETYPGVVREDIEILVRKLDPDLSIDVSLALKPEAEIDELVEPFVTDDPVFGYLTSMSLDDFFDPSKIEEMRRRVRDARGTVVVYGTGASLVSTEGLLIYADMPRWEGQLRQRRSEAANLGSTNPRARAGLQYKRSFFVDWRVCDRVKRALFPRIGYFLDTTDRSEPKLIEGTTLLDSLHKTSSRPFRVVPYFDPAPWGGEWMRKICDLDKEAVNFGWCFDCVPEENSLLLDFDGVRFETPSINLIFTEPRAVLGDHVYDQFGAEFPIRFDFLDTMEGGNLSLQVHPLTHYIQERFGMPYTQDESYYLLDAGENGCVYLGLRSDAEPRKMAADLALAAKGNFRFPDQKYINKWPAKRHDHFLIPAGTVHCSGANSMVLEISATPYIFTFKLWDWERLGLDGVPRPIHLEHGINSIQWDRRTEWVQRELINRFEVLGQGEGWVEERTGLHVLEFIETRRHWFETTVNHPDGTGVNVLNLVEGEEVLVESPDAAFEPFIVHYAETFIVPAAAGPYTIRPVRSAKGVKAATIKASIRI